MSGIIVVLGESGTGKSTSMRNLKPDETFVINVLSKPLPFKGYKKNYNEERKNLLETDSYKKIIEYIKAVSLRRPEIKTIVIDDFSFLMNNEFMRRCKEKGFDKFVDMGLNMFNLFNSSSEIRHDLTVYLMCHTEKDHAGMIKPRSVGKMTADYVGLGERATIVLHTQVIDGRFKFLTQNNGYHMAKSPMGMFDSLYIDNDLAMVNEQVRSYYED